MPLDELIKGHNFSGDVVCDHENVKETTYNEDGTFAMVEMLGGYRERF